MPWGLLTSCRSENLGDEIQTLAAAAFLPRVDVLVDRDYLAAYRREHARILLNGWFLIGEHWPPPDGLEPLLVSFYATSEHVGVLAQQNLGWYRRHEPIGCRSLGMLRRAEVLGLNAYFSGCLTLTLPKRAAPETGKTLLVDCDPELLRRLVPARVIARAEQRTHVELSDAGSLERRLARRMLMGRGHYPSLLAFQLLSRLRAQRHAERMLAASALLDAYAGAKLVITSRLHCYLPCLALGTPVILLNGAGDDDRFSGLAELGRAYGPEHDPIELDWDNPEPNPGRHERLAAELRRTVREWVDRADDKRTR